MEINMKKHKRAFIYILQTLILIFPFLACNIGKDIIAQNQYGVFLSIEDNLSQFDEYETVVIDAQYFSAEEIMSFKESGHKVYSYINVGALEDYRDYYSKYEYLALGDYEHWDEEVWIDVSSEEWQRFILDELAPMLKDKGIDGFFVDNCDVYYQYPCEEIMTGLTDIMQGLIATNLDVIINGGDVYLNAYCEAGGSWNEVITGINQESVFSYIDWDTGALTYASDEDKEYFLDYIERYGDKGAYIFLLEYVDDSPENRPLHGIIKDYCEEHNYLYYISDSIDLD